MASPESILADRAAPVPWLSIIGIGEDGIAGLTPTARARIEEAEIVFGGTRHLDLAAALLRGERCPWPTPFDLELGAVLAARGRRVCVLASGDPFQFGIGPLLARKVPAPERIAIPSTSAFSLAAAELGWSLPETQLVSIHGRPIEGLGRHLAPGARLLVLTSDQEGPTAIATYLREAGFGPSAVTVLECLGGPRARVRRACADGFALHDVDRLNLVAIECEALAGAPVLPLTPGLPDAAFEHDGQLTKRDIRTLSLGQLAPRRGELLWDVGAGSGSIAIEWMRQDPSLQAIAIEMDPARVARIRRNARALGAPGLRVVEGRAPAALDGLASPNAIFVGGGANESLLAAVLGALRPRGRLVVNAVTLETEAQLAGRYSQLGGELRHIALSTAAPLGRRTGWQPARPIVQWCWQKP